MLVATEHVKKKYKDYFKILLIGLVLSWWRHWEPFAAIGCVFAIFLVAEILMSLSGHLVARILYERVYPKSVEELKHTSKQFQYILKLDGKDVYSYVYNLPLNKVEVRCWRFIGSYLIEVVRKKR